MAKRLPLALVRYGSRTPARRLFCLPYAGGGVASFRPWGAALPPDVEVAAVQLPGRESRIREPSYTVIADIVAELCPLIEQSADVPYAIFGHSMGALIAFELTCALEERNGFPPSHLFVSARRAPDAPDAFPPIHAMPEHEFLDELQARYGAIPPAIRQESDLMALLLPALRADITAIETYAYRPDARVSCPVSVYGGLSDRHPTPSQLPDWQRASRQTIHTRTFAGDHFYLAAQRDALLADMMSRWLNASTAAPAS